MLAYKLLHVRRDGSVGPLYIHRHLHIVLGNWMYAEDHPTKGYKHRPGWHCVAKPEAPHLSMKGRQWYQVEIDDYCTLLRPKHQGGLWFIAQRMRVIGPAK